MPRVPRSVRFAVPRSLAVLVLRTTRTLSPADPRVGQKPSSAYATRSLLAHGARDHRRPRRWPQPPPTTPSRWPQPPPTTPSRWPQPPPTTPSRRSAQWVTSDKQTWVTSRKRRSFTRFQLFFMRPPRPSSSGATEKTNQAGGSRTGHRAVSGASEPAWPAWTRRSQATLRSPGPGWTSNATRPPGLGPELAMGLRRSRQDPGRHPEPSAAPSSAQDPERAESCPGS